MSAPRVVITGVGPVTAAGIGRTALADALVAGRSGIRPRARIAAPGLRAQTAGELQGFDVAEYLETPKTYLDRSSELAFAALSLALEDANLDLSTVDKSSAGLMLGTAYGSLETMATFYADLLDKGPRLVKPVLFPHSYANTAISLLAIEYGLAGPHLLFTSGGVASAQALLTAFDWIRAGRASLVFAGGMDALSLPLLTGLELAGLASPADGGPERCTPFDRARNGYVPGEGAGILVLESDHAAAARGAPVLGELLAAGTAAAADGSSLALETGLARAMALALRGSRSVDAVVAAANGSPAADAAEARALRRVFPTGVPVTSANPLWGETAGAAGALQVATALAMFESGTIPAILNLTDADPACPVQAVMGAPRAVPLERVLVNAVDAGGTAVSLLLGKGT
jgi:3-oxoacyl-[acyl-carrier-protein] synthase II